MRQKGPERRYDEDRGIWLESDGTPTLWCRGDSRYPCAHMEKVRLTKGLETIQKVLDYAADGSQSRYNMLLWTKNAVDDLLDGRGVVEPPRASEEPTKFETIPIAIETNPLVPEGEIQLCIDGHVVGRIVNCTIDCKLAEEPK